MSGCCCGDSKDDKPGGRPGEHRCCTDILFLILFVAFWVGMIYIAVFTGISGSVFRLVFGYDSYGNVCNMANNQKLHENLTLGGKDMSGKPNVFFMDLKQPKDALQLCVKQCPTKDLRLKSDVKMFAEETGSRLCRYDIPISQYADDGTVYGIDGPCPDLPVLKGISLMNRCAPDISQSGIMNKTRGFFEFINADDVFRKVLSDLYTSWKEILILCAIALVIALLMVVLIRFLASVIVWLVVILAAVGSIALTAFLWWTYVQTKNSLDRDTEMNIPLLDVNVRNERAFLIMAIIATVLMVILLLVILVMRKRLALVVALFHEAGKCIGSMPLLLIQPLWTFLILILFFAYWILVLGNLATAGEAATNDKGRVYFKEDAIVRHMWWYHIIGLIWTAEFILACQQMAVAGAVAMWYFERNKSDLACPVGKSICRLIMHHIGSLALGSFIILLVKLPRLILMYIQTKFQGQEGACAKCCLKCCMCCLWCLEKILKFLNQNAYTVIAIEGSSFCPSARRAFSIITSNVLRVAAINSVGDFVLFLGKIGVMASTAAISVIWLKEKEGLHYFAVPVIIVATFAFLIGHCFLTIYEMVIDTLLLCFCEDCNMNDGTEGKEYYMSKSLMEFVKETSNKISTKDQAYKMESETEPVNV